MHRSKVQGKSFSSSHLFVSSRSWSPIKSLRISFPYQNGNWIEKHNNTIGVDFSIKTINVDGKRVKLQIWDTAGQERFRTITQSYYRSANGVIIVYDITKRQSYVNLQRWIDEVRRYTASNVILALVGNKCDLEGERQVDQAEVAAMCEAIPEIMFSIETSAKDNTNIENVFQNLAKELKVRRLFLLSITFILKTHSKSISDAKRLHSR